jgi:hypothetical protein
LTAKKGGAGNSGEQYLVEAFGASDAGAIDVAASLNTRGGGKHDLETETFLVQRPIAIKGAAIGRQPENGPQRGEYMEDACFTLNCTENHAIAYTENPDAAYGFSVGQSASAGTIGYQEDQAPTLRGASGSNQVPGVLTQPVAFNVTLCDANGVRPDRPHGGIYVNETEQASTVTSGRPGFETVICDSETPIAFQERGRDGGRSLDYQEDLAYAITSPNGGGRRQEMNIQSGPVARRLTPVECERLQGMPDGHTDIIYRGKPVTDGPRYRAIGNSFAVPVVTWLGERIELVLQTLQSHFSESG